MASEQEQYNELASYTLAHTDPGVPSPEHCRRSYGTATDADKPVKITFALIGLYLCVEKGQAGRQAQLVHMRLAKQRKQWPRFSPPAERGSVRAGDVIAAAPGADRDAMIHRWCESVWAAWKEAHVQIAELCERELGIAR